MKEIVEFAYWFTDENGNDTKRVIIRREDENGINATELCDAFLDFMVSAGFSEQNVLNYFS